MASTLVKLSVSPMSSRWDLAAVRGEYRYWRSRNGKLFAEHTPTKTWFAVKTEKAK
jgi:hypothetical protein